MQRRAGLWIPGVPSRKVVEVRRTVALLASAVMVSLLACGGSLLGMGEPARAAFPGTNGKIAFYKEGDVWTMNPNGTSPTRLTTNYNAEANPAVSPDGSRITYEFLRGLWIMNSDGSGKRQLTDGSVATDEDPTWSADGTKIAFVRNADVWSINTTGEGLRNLTRTSEDEEFDPAWSPSGATIAYTRTGSIYVMNANGSAQTNLTPEDSLPQCPDSPGYYHDGASRAPSWSPDGTKITFSGALICPHVLGRDIWVMNANGSGKKNLIDDEGTSDLRPAFSPDGQKIVFESNRDSDKTELYAMSATDGSGITRLTTNSVLDNDADWAPLDVTAPSIIRVTPADRATGVAPNVTVTATFSEAMRANSIYRVTFKLVKAGTTSPVSATVSYDPASARATLDPASNLASGATYRATVTTGARDAAGNGLAANKTWSFKVR